MRSPTSQSTVHFHNGSPLKIEQHAKYLRVTLSNDGSAQRHHYKTHPGSQTLSLTTPVLTKHRPHTQVEASHIQRRFHSTHTASNLQPAPQETTTDSKLSIHKAFAKYSTSKAPPRLLHSGPAAHSTHLHQPGDTHSHKAASPYSPHPQSTAEIFGHILRSLPNSTERNCCFTHKFQYRGGPLDRTNQCIKVAWHWLSKSSRPPPSHSLTFPYSYLQAH